jgi:hypothetical protein
MPQPHPTTLFVDLEQQNALFAINFCPEDSKFFGQRFSFGHSAG